MKKAVMDFWGVLKDLKTILSWFETWVPTFITMGVVGFWCLFAFAHSLPNPWRTILVWGTLLGMVAIVPERR
ncbi:MAG: hypothetical protein U9O89_04365 [Thermoproteota archaeon]|nr:hypothetical protein [Thermoproteota archaeon]